MTATASYRLARIAGGFRLSLSVHIIKIRVFKARFFGFLLTFIINTIVGNRTSGVIIAIAIARAFGKPSGTRNKGSDLLFVITDLHFSIIDNDRTAKNAWIRANESDEFRNRHIVEINLSFRNNLASRRNNIIRPIDGFGNDLLEVIRA